MCTNLVPKTDIYLLTYTQFLCHRYLLCQTGLYSSKTNRFNIFFKILHSKMKLFTDISRNIRDIKVKDCFERSYVISQISVLGEIFFHSVDNHFKKEILHLIHSMQNFHLGFFQGNSKM